MSRPSFTVVATREATAAARWYEAERKGRGLAFARAMEAALQLIEHRPESFPAAGTGFHRVVIRRFPYALFYRIEPDAVVVHAVFHTARDPSKLHDRLRGA